MKPLKDYSRDELLFRVQVYDDANVALRALLVRAATLIQKSDPKSPVFKEILKALAVDGDPGEELNKVRESLEDLTIDIQVWHGLHPDDIGVSDKVNLNHALELLDKPKRYEGVPDK